MVVFDKSTEYESDPSYLIQGKRTSTNLAYYYVLVPFPIKQMVIFQLDRIILLKEIFNLVRQVICTQASLSRMKIVLSLSYPHTMKCGAGQNRVLYHFEKRGLELRREIIENLGRRVQKSLPRKEYIIRPEFTQQSTNYQVWVNALSIVSQAV